VTFVDCLNKPPMVSLVHVGIHGGELGDGAIKGVSGSEVGGDRDRVS